MAKTWTLKAGKHDDGPDAAEEQDDPEGRNTAAYVDAQENAYIDNIASIGA